MCESKLIKIIYDEWDRRCDLCGGTPKFDEKRRLFVYDGWTLCLDCKTDIDKRRNG